MIYAAKRLTRSDLTLFDVQFRRQNAGNQKSINLNRRVFVDLVFPRAPAHAGGQAAQFPVTLRIIGPGGEASFQQLQRKVIAAGGRQKNWRLNGETVRAPDADPTRYDGLQEGDFAIMGFEGDDVPVAIDLYLVSQDDPLDVTIHRELEAILADRSMGVLSQADLNTLVALGSAVSVGHPVGTLHDPEGEEALEEAALGSSAAVQRLRRRPVRRQSAADLAIARRRAEAVGRDGEVLVAGYLRGRALEGRIAGFVWDSESNAVNPWDMTLTSNDGTVLRIEVKSTSGPHGRAMHVSQAEIETAAEPGAARTEIWRVSGLTGDSGILRRSRGFPALARDLTARCADFGAGAVPDGWTISPDRLTWGEPRTLRFDDDPEE